MDRPWCYNRPVIFRIFYLFMIFSYLYAKLMERLRGTAIRNSSIHPTSVIYPGCNLLDVVMDRYSYCSHDCQIVCCDIGSFCSISDHVFIGGAEHPMEWVSTSPVFQKVKHSGPVKRFAKYELPPMKRTIIGSDVWIGHGATIKQGVKIGHGAVVGSNSVVTKDVPPYAIVGGVPAQIIRYRFTDETISALLESAWWKMNDSEIQQNAQLIKNPNMFIEKIK